MSSGDADKWKPVIGTNDIDSTPPASTMSLVPNRIEPAAVAIACRPLEQNRLIVCAGTSTPRSASSEISRATLRPCSPSGIAQPSTTSSILPLTCGTRATRPRTTSAASSSGRLVASAPLKPRPTAERTASAMTMSVISIPQGLVVLEHVLHARLRERLTAQRQERFALEVEDLVLAHRVRGARDA